MKVDTVTSESNWTVILKMFIYHSPAISLLGIYPGEIPQCAQGVICKNICVVALIVNNRKQLKYI